MKGEIADGKFEAHGNFPRLRWFPKLRWFPRLRWRRDRDLDRRPRQHFFVEGIEFRIRLAPAAIGKAEIGIAEYADKTDLGDIERPRQRVRVFLESRHTVPCPFPVIVDPCLPL